MRNASFALSFPFTAGVLAGQLLHGPGAASAAAQAIAFAGPFAIIGLAVLLACCRSRAGLTGAVLFFCLGLWCAVIRQILPANGIGSGNDITAATLEALRSRIESLPFGREETASLLEALLTGRKAALDKETIVAFRSAGAAHILALSGLHLGVLSAVLDRMLRVLGNSRAARALRAFAVIAAALFYTLMCGKGASLVRAFIFICISKLTSLAPGRRKDGATTLCTALVVQLAIRPEWIGDPAFQLSYLSMCAIFFLYPHLERWHPAAGNRRNITVRMW
ncbi:MAG: ComEC/Rec2 family competence protein, partial [Bacteroidales bacterium]|nr:ComEC/Rec2 family competence protein [Candidatus Cryptobacteroides aphodequi]